MKQLDSFDFFGKDAEFDHAGIAVKSIDDVLRNVQKTKDPIQKVSVAMIRINNFKVELVEPISDHSPVTKILGKGQSIYHLCFRVQNINIAIEIARKNGFHCIAKPTPAEAFNNKRIAWLFNKFYGLIELLEK